METEDDAPIAREPWQRLLRERYDAPPEITDARIRAAARRALAPRPSRWWLPASLAASVLLAVMLVQWQLGDDRAPAYVTESDVAAPMSAAPQAAEEAADAAVSAEAAAESAGSAREVREVPAVRPETAPPSTPPSLRELPAYSAPPEPARQSAPAAPARADESRSLGKLGGMQDSAAVPRDPEEWYAEIEALRADGQIEEAEAELERLEAAWPGWIEKNHPQNR